MSGMRVEQAIGVLRKYLAGRVGPEPGALTTISNALAESHPNDACRNFWKLVATTAEARLAESEKENARLEALLEDDPWAMKLRKTQQQLAESEKEVERLREALERIEPMQQHVLAWFRQTGVVFERAPLTVAPTNDSERWEEVAFRIYSYLCEVDSIARQALSPDSQEKTMSDYPDGFCKHGVMLGDANPNRPCPECVREQTTTQKEN